MNGALSHWTRLPKKTGSSGQVRALTNDVTESVPVHRLAPDMPVRVSLAHARKGLLVINAVLALTVLAVVLVSGCDYDLSDVH